MAHRRLKIIDLSDAANQPFCWEHLALVFNGEIYNYLELRLELEALGRKFSTSSDTEVLLRAYECWGSDCFSRLEGPFALAIHDKKKNILVLARDRFGEKPLYYLKQDERLYFGSTLDAISDVIGTTKIEADLVSLRSYLVLGFVCAPNTPKLAINKLKPGQLLSFSLPSLDMTECFFGFNKSQFIPNPGAKEFCIETFESLLLSSLSKRFRADLPIILLLSGGIDSTYLACLAKKVLKLNFEAITIADNFVESAEISRAREVCRILGIPHTLVNMNLDDFNQRGRVFLSATDDVSADPAFPVLCELFSATPKNAVVFLTGDGSDELFLSYSNYSRLLFSKPFINSNLLKRLSPLFFSWIPRPIFLRCLPDIVSDVGKKLKITLKTEFSRFGMNDEIPASIDSLVDGIGALYQYSIENELPEYLLYKTDRASMMLSKEARAPFVDAALFNYMLSCNWGNKILGNKSHIVTRINYYLGKDLSFTKLGMAAGGQKNYKIPFSEISKTIQLLASGIGIFSRFRLYFQLATNPMTRFRVLAIHAWIHRK
jgi:asparagine synthase (glutamine-hydrolysing)